MFAQCTNTHSQCFLSSGDQEPSASSTKELEKDTSRVANCGGGGIHSTIPFYLVI